MTFDGAINDKTIITCRLQAAAVYIPVLKSTSAGHQKDGIHVVCVCVCVCTTTPSLSAASRPIDHSVSIRRSLPHTTLTILVSSFIMPKVDYCNVLLAGLPQRNVCCTNYVNAAARLSADARKYDHVSNC